ncbi:MAG: hypothetical protein PSV13_21085 [Lacunisphaera sp.]|nr:hypothetical protein [Lacunisphaera sp.]
MKFEPWHYGTWEGARDARRETDMQRSLAEIILLLEDMEQLAVRLHRQRRQAGLPVDPKIALLLDEPLVAEDQAPYAARPTPPTP